MPGDELRVEDKELYVNGEASEDYSTLMQHYQVEVRENIRLSPAKVREAGARILQSGNGSHIINMTRETADQMEQWGEVNSVEPFILPEDFNEFGRRGFNFSRGFTNHDHLGPFTVPHAGQQIELTRENWHIYRDILERYEHNSVQITGDQFTINGEETNQYTIQKDYYFMMGDNRDDSEDSRYWGFVPDDHIVGKASLIYFSWDNERWLPRFDRIFNFIN